MRARQFSFDGVLCKVTLSVASMSHATPESISRQHHNKSTQKVSFESLSEAGVWDQRGPDATACWRLPSSILLEGKSRDIRSSTASLKIRQSSNQTHPTTGRLACPSDLLRTNHLAEVSDSRWYGAEEA